MAYIYGTPVTGKDFYGRKELLDELVQFNPAETYFLNGIRRIGKSSVLKEVERRTNEQGYLSIYLDLLGGYNSNDFGNELGRIIVNYLIDNNHPCNESEWEDLSFEDTFEKWVDYCQTNNQRSFLLLDEAEKLQLLSKESAEILYTLIYRSRNVIQVILTGTRMFWKLDQTEHSKLELLHNLLTQRYVGMLEEDEAIRVITKAQDNQPIKADEKLLSLILEACGGHPYLLQYICGNLHSNGKLSLPSSVNIIPYNDQLKTVFLNDFGLISHEEQAFLKSLITPNPQKFTNQVELINLGIIQILEDKPKFSSKLFESWVNDTHAISINKYTSQTSKLNLFISYSKHDEHHKNTFINQLAGLRNQIITWNDKDIMPGEDWDKSIKKAIHDADVVVYLVSPNSLATEYIQQVELPMVEELCKSGKCRLVPVIVDFCVWTELSFAQYNALPEKGIPITDRRRWQNENEAWMKVVEGIRELL